MQDPGPDYAAMHHEIDVANRIHANCCTEAQRLAAVLHSKSVEVRVEGSRLIIDSRNSELRKTVVEYVERRMGPQFALKTNMNQGLDESDQSSEGIIDV